MSVLALPSRPMAATINRDAERRSEKLARTVTSSRKKENFCRDIGAYGISSESRRRFDPSLARLAGGGVDEVMRDPIARSPAPPVPAGGGDRPRGGWIQDFCDSEIAI